jgi:hypothetical protein
MQNSDLQKLLDDATSHILGGKGVVAILSLSDVTLRLIRSFRDLGLIGAISAVYAVTPDATHAPALEGVRVLALPRT